MYEFSNFSLKKANSNFNDLNHIYEISVTKSTIIENNENNKVPKLNFSFKQISDIIEFPSNTITGNK